MMKRTKWFVFVFLLVSSIGIARTIHYCKDSSYVIFCEKDYITNVIIPEGDSVAGVISPNKNEWIVNYKYNFVIIIPRTPGARSNLTIITNRKKLYVLDIEEGPGDRKVYLEECRKDLKDYYSQILKSKKKEEEKTSRIKKTEEKYEIKDRYFKIEKVWDDNIFTFISFPKSQVSPAVFISRSKRKKFEPVRYSHRNGSIVIHKILKKKEFFILKYGDETSYIGREK